jgi:NDP-sugar pyrophosphorylase family protein
VTQFSDEVVAVVLAGGFGTRIRPVLGELPKPMAPVAGRPFVEWIVRYLARQGLKQVVLSTGYRAEVIESHFKTHPVSDIEVTCVVEGKPLGTAGGFLNAARSIRNAPQAWLVLNGDSLAIAPLSPVLGTLSDPHASGAIVGVRMEDASRYGTLALDERRFLTQFLEKQPGSGIINAGIYLFRDSVVRSFPSKKPLSFETDVFPSLLAAKAQFAVTVSEAPFLDIGTPDSLELADGFIERHSDWFC